MIANDTRKPCAVIPIRRPPPPRSAHGIAPPPRERTRSGIFEITARSIFTSVVHECVDAALEAYEEASKARARGDAEDSDGLNAAARTLVDMIAETFADIEALP